MTYLSELWPRIRHSITWLSVQIQAIWAFIWFMWSQLPSEEMVKLSVQHIFYLTVPTWMGLSHAATTYLARMAGTKPPEQP